MYNSQVNITKTLKVNDVFIKYSCIIIFVTPDIACHGGVRSQRAGHCTPHSDVPKRDGMEQDCGCLPSHIKGDILSSTHILINYTGLELLSSFATI